MTDTTAQLEGHIDAPGALELFWDKNKRIVYGFLALLVLLMAGKYGLEYQERQARDEKWSAFAENSGLAKAYTDPDTSVMDMFLNNPNLPPEQAQMLIAQGLGFAAMGMTSGYLDQVGELDRATLQAALGSADADTAASLLWTMACQAYLAEDWEDAKQDLERLQRDYPESRFCASSAYPAQWRKELESDQEETVEDGTDDGADPNADEEPELEPVAAGSLADRLLAAVDRQRSFIAANRSLYEAPEPPADAPVVVFTFDGPDAAFQGEVAVRLFTDRAPQHTARILAMAEGEEPFWQGLKVHEVRRSPLASSSMARNTAEELSVGLRATRESELRTDWIAEDPLEDNILDWEASTLSHFPGMLAVEPHTEGRSQVERLVFNTTDAAGQRDGTRVIVGRVVRGLELLESMVSAVEFTTETDTDRGFGAPADLITVTSVRVER